VEPAQWVGREIDGRYRIEAVLGVGGMGTVLRARHQFTGVPVALKILHPQFQLDPDVQARFLAEAQAPNAIGHPAIVKVTDAGRTAEGTLYMAMELLVGRSLRAALAQHLAPDQIKRMMAELLVALGQAHARGFVHRDLKPDNVFLCAPNDEVKLLDFGIAKVLDDARRRTAAGALLGTPAYMAPEQLADASNVDSRADLWAVGVMLFEMITRRLPLPGTSIHELMIAVASGNVIPIRQVMPGAPVELEQFFARALAVDPRRRFGAAVELAQAFASLPLESAASPLAVPQASHTTVPSVVHTPPEAARQVPITTMPPPPPARASKVLLGVAALAVVAIVAGVVIAVTGRSSKPQVAAIKDAAPVVEPAPREPDAAVTTPSERSCEQRCRDLSTQCDTRLASCVKDCESQHTAFVECYDKSMNATETQVNACFDGVMCGFEKICGGKKPAGSASCADTLVCQGTCRDLACLCACDAKLDPSHALVLAQFNACVSVHCATALNRECFVKHCGSQTHACGLVR